MSSTVTYSLPAETHAKLNVLVDRIEAHPGDMIDVREFQELQSRLNVREVVRTLPEGLSEDDFTGILKLALLTECATETYGDAFEERARRYDAPWLGRFNERVWVPDELTHHTPYKYILMSMGFAEEELDREIRHIQSINYIHRGGDTPVHVTTFGIVQEYLTDKWHGMIANMLQEASPEAAYMATRIKRRETLHTAWYRDMVALQIEADPRFIAFVAEALVKFEMPGNTLVPELQRAAIDWMPYMGADNAQTARDLVRYIYQTMGDVNLAGKLVMEIATQKGLAIGPISPRMLQAAINRLGGPGYGLLGEAMLERVGLSYLFETGKGRKDSAFALYDGAYERVRGLLRTWVSKQIEFSFDA